MDRKPRPRITEPKDVGEALEAMDQRREEKAARDAAAMQTQWGNHRDIEEYPTPHTPEKRGEVERIEVNVQSLEALTTDLLSFLRQAEEISAQIPGARDIEAQERVMEYFQRLYAVIARLSNDVSGDNYTTRFTHAPLAIGEVTPELRENMLRICGTITDGFAMTQPGVLFQESGRAGESSQLYPFADWMRDILKGTRYLQRYFEKH